MDEGKIKPMETGEGHSGVEIEPVAGGVRYLFPRGERNWKSAGASAAFVLFVGFQVYRATRKVAEKAWENADLIELGIALLILGVCLCMLGLAVVMLFGATARVRGFIEIAGGQVRDGKRWLGLAWGERVPLTEVQSVSLSPSFRPFDVADETEMTPDERVRLGELVDVVVVKRDGEKMTLLHGPLEYVRPFAEELRGVMLGQLPALLGRDERIPITTAENPWKDKATGYLLPAIERQPEGGKLKVETIAEGVRLVLPPKGWSWGGKAMFTGGIVLMGVGILVLAAWFSTAWGSPWAWFGIIPGGLFCFGGWLLVRNARRNANERLTLEALASGGVKVTRVWGKREKSWETSELDTLRVEPVEKNSELFRLVVGGRFRKKEIFTGLEAAEFRWVKEVILEEAELARKG